MEVGAGLSKNGMDVTIVFPEKHLMERLFTPEIAQFYEKYYQDKGITLKSGSLATEFKGKDGTVSLLSQPCCSSISSTAFVLDGSLPCINALRC